MRNDARTVRHPGARGWEILPEHLVEPRPETPSTATIRERQIAILKAMFDTIAGVTNDDPTR